MILIALGANLPGRFGAPEAALTAAQDAMAAQGVRVLESSSVWLTAPVPVSDQPWYRNAVVSVETNVEPVALLAVLKGIERDFGRSEDVRNAARVLDLDIIAYRNVTNKLKDCTIPHPRMHERAFVLYPLREVAPGWIHPILGRSVDDLIADLPAGQEIEKLEREAE